MPLPLTIIILIEEGILWFTFNSSNMYLQELQIVLESSDDSGNLTDNWQFALFELASSHYAAICVEKDVNIKGAFCLCN